MATSVCYFGAFTSFISSGVNLLPGFFLMAVGFLKIKRHSCINVLSVLQGFVLTELFGIPVVFRFAVKVVSG